MTQRITGSKKTIRNNETRNHKENLYTIDAIAVHEGKKTSPTTVRFKSCSQMAETDQEYRDRSQQDQAFQFVFSHNISQDKCE